MAAPGRDEHVEVEGVVKAHEYVNSALWDLYILAMTRSVFESKLRAKVAWYVDSGSAVSEQVQADVGRSRCRPTR